ncbi:GAF domain-containing protein [Caldovatus sediminis]|uniref:GAF domain-containing protein n=1 Tax=Caldovatus sediminis TaxID=2041189 RepID=UPI001669DB30
MSATRRPRPSQGSAPPRAGRRTWAIAPARRVAVHVRYLKTMGVAVSLSASIVRDGALWGLVACHHRVPRAVPTSCAKPASTSARSCRSGLRRGTRPRRTPRRAGPRGRGMGSSPPWRTAGDGEALAERVSEPRAVVSADGAAEGEPDGAPGRSR